MMFTSVTGHLMEMEFEGRYRKWHSCDPVDLFKAPIRKHVPEGIGFVEVCWEIHQAAQQLARPNQLFSEAVNVRQGCLGVAYGSFGMF
ncbi:putative DNA topoisomerase [Helianthus annuus]|nr:putative DNA topoisomerase [Helianthus annuus]